MISTELSMIQMLNPYRHKLALLQEEFLSKGGTVEVLEGPAFKPPPPRHEPPPTVKKAKPQKKVEPPRQKWIDKMAHRDIEREERALKREQDRADKLEYVRHLAQTMTYAQAVLPPGSRFESSPGSPRRVGSSSSQRRPRPIRVAKSSMKSETPETRK